MKKLIMILTCIIASVGLSVAQTTRVSGTILDDTGETVIGASVVAKGTTVGTVTDIDGNFSLNIPSDKKTLVISLIGMKTKEVAAGTNLKIIMENDSKLMDEVVVTAMGISRDEKALGYSVSTLKADELLKARESNVLNSLAGKVAGVRVSGASGTLGGSSKVIIRGANSLDGNNQPLFVIDGMPIDNGSQGSASNNVVAGGVDNGNRAGDINADDVETMTVLKGAAATALYGARAKNGAIIITTKKGTKGSKLSVEVNSSTRFDSVLKLPDFQNEYSQGTYGDYDLKYSNGWGARIQGQKVTNFLGQETSLQAYKDNVKDFYDTGKTYINSVALAGGSEQADYRVGLTALNQTGILPNTAMDRYTFNANVGYNFSKKLTSRTIFSYNTTVTHGRPSQSSNDPNVLAEVVNSLPRNLDIHALKNNWRDAETGQQIGVTSDNKTNNPYWILNRNMFKSSLERVIANEMLTYKPVEWISISNNLGIDFYNERRRQITSQGTFGDLKGSYSDDNIYSQVINNDFLVTLTRSLSSDLELKVIGGHNIFQRTARRDLLDANDLTVDGLYNPGNAASVSNTATYSRKRLMGIYGDVGLAYRNFLYLNVTGRNDWSSTLPKNNRSYFYPSVSSSFVFTELMEDKSILSFGNIRASWANVGSDEDPYQLDFVYTPASTYYVQYSLNGTFPNNGLLGFTIPRVYPPENLKPQNQVSFEIGTNMKFLNNRIGVDFTYYNISTKDQIVSVDVPLSTGFFAKKVNIGEVRNRGIELALNLVPVRTRDFEWNIDVNYAQNKQTVEKLIAGNPDFVYNLASGWSGLQIQAKEGEAFGMYGTMWERNEDGQIVIDETTGLRKIKTGQRIGDVAPKWTMGINNSFFYKGISLSFLLDFRKGGVIYSGTVSSLRTNGLAAETAANRGETFIDEGVILDASGNYVANNVPVANMQDYWSHMAKASNTEGSVFDASYVKLRELRVGYQLPKSWIRGLLLQNAEIAFEGRNLWIIKDHVPHIDPEASMFGVNSAGEGVEFNSVPTTKSLGVNIRLSF